MPCCYAPIFNERLLPKFQNQRNYLSGNQRKLRLFVIIVVGECMVGMVCALAVRAQYDVLYVWHKQALLVALLSKYLGVALDSLLDRYHQRNLRFVCTAVSV